VARGQAVTTAASAAAAAAAATAPATATAQGGDDEAVGSAEEVGPGVLLHIQVALRGHAGEGKLAQAAAHFAVSAALILCPPCPPCLPCLPSRPRRYLTSARLPPSRG